MSDRRPERHGDAVVADGDGRWRMWAIPAPDRRCGVRYDAPGTRWFAQQHSDTITAVAVTVTLDDEGAYWGWITEPDGPPKFVYRTKGLLDMCFPYGINAEERRGTGRAVRLSVAPADEHGAPVPTRADPTVCVMYTYRLRIELPGSVTLDDLAEITDRLGRIGTVGERRGRVVDVELSVSQPNDFAAGFALAQTIASLRNDLRAHGIAEAAAYTLTALHGSPAITDEID